ncbi:hypothetical protein CL617_01885 [archaeon]|nr:hypothetical protein [archaeon]|tara:strand:+ start:7035 stop:7610 length:576 start_codon:yes stop_codon:yes gene_type:complete
MENIVEKANRIAEECHYDQIYKSTGGAFYESHLVPVWDLLKEVGFPEKTQAVGLLHDILEDTELALGELRELFGDEIAYAVHNLSEDKKLERKERVEEYLENVVKSYHSISVCLADQIHNSGGILNNPPVMEKISDDVTGAVDDTKEWITAQINKYGLILFTLGNINLDDKQKKLYDKLYENFTELDKKYK